MSTTVAEAYRHCEAITRSQARNFSYGIALLPGPKRRALSAVYAFARRVDDVGDGDLPVERKLDELDGVRKQLRAVGTDSDDAVLVALADAARRRPIPLEAFDELVDGCEADVRGMEYRTYDELVHYCRCVAGSIGRLSLGVFGADDMGAAAREADELGIALQLTNILRDVAEDRRDGRVYLPAEDLDRFGVSLDRADASYAALVRFEADRAERRYTNGLALLARLDRRSRACCAAMAGIYHRLLGRIAADPARTMRERVSLTGRQKAVVVARSLAGMAP